MELGISFIEIAQLLLYVLAIGFPTAWLLSRFYKVWRKANAPSILALVTRQRRRDKKIKETAERVDKLVTALASAELRIVATDEMQQEFNNRIGKIETKVQQLRSRLRAKGIVIDA